MAVAGLINEQDADAVADLQETLTWAKRIRSDPAQSTICLLLADTVIEQTQELLTQAQEQLDRCNVLQPLPQAHRVSS